MLGCGENNSKKGVKPHKILPRLPLGSLRSLVFRCCPQLRSLDRGYRFIELTVKRAYYTALLLLGKESIEWLTLRVFQTVKFAGFMPVKGVKYYLKWKSHRFFFPQYFLLWISAIRRIQKQMWPFWIWKMSTIKGKVGGKQTQNRDYWRLTFVLKQRHKNKFRYLSWIMESVKLNENLYLQFVVIIA